MRVRLTTGVLLALMTSAGPVRSQIMCERVAKVLGMATQTFEAASRRWTDCLSSNSPCQTERLSALRAKTVLEQTRMEANRQCPHLAD
jgi:hypothetical protein